MAAVSETETDEQLLGSPEGARFVVLRRLLEAMTGRKVSVARIDQEKQGSAPTIAAQPRPGDAPAPPSSASAGWGLELDIERARIDTTSVNFSATGTILTEDGQAIAFDAAFVKQDVTLSVERISLRQGDAKMQDPLVLLYSGTQTELAAQTRAFDLNADGQLEQLPGVSNGAYVVLDRNNNGTVDDGSEVLGALSGDGFADLRALDEDGNGFVDGGDRAFSGMSLWELGPSGERLVSLDAAGVMGLYSGSVQTAMDLKAPEGGDLLGRVRATGIYVTNNGTVHPMEQIDVKA